MSYEPQPTCILRRRFPECLRRRFDYESVPLGYQTPPNMLRDQLFDFDGGLRLCVAIENGEEGERLIVGTGVVEDSALAKSLPIAVQARIESFMGIVQFALRSLSPNGEVPTLKPLQMSDGWPVFEGVVPESWIPG